MSFDEKALEQALRDAFPFAKDWESASPEISLSAIDGSTLYLFSPNAMRPVEWISGLEFVPFSNHMTVAENPYDAIEKLKEALEKIQKLTES